MNNQNTSNPLYVLRRCNNERQIEWNAGAPSDPLYMATELGGEVGEALNVVKKLVRETQGKVGSRATVEDLAHELADVIICVDLLAAQYNINIEVALIQKFNKTSRKNGLKTLMHNTWHPYDTE